MLMEPFYEIGLALHLAFNDLFTITVTFSPRGPCLDCCVHWVNIKHLFSKALIPHIFKWTSNVIWTA